MREAAVAQALPVLTVLLAAVVWTVASLLVATVCSVLARGARLAADREIEHLARVAPAAGSADVAAAVPGPRRSADDLASLA